MACPVQPGRLRDSYMMRDALGEKGEASALVYGANALHEAVKAYGARKEKMNSRVKRSVGPYVTVSCSLQMGAARGSPV